MFLNFKKSRFPTAEPVSDLRVPSKAAAATADTKKTAIYIVSIAAAGLALVHVLGFPKPICLSSGNENERSAAAPDGQQHMHIARCRHICRTVRGRLRLSGSVRAVRLISLIARKPQLQRFWYVFRDVGAKQTPEQLVSFSTTAATQRRADEQQGLKLNVLILAQFLGEAGIDTCDGAGCRN